MDYFSCPIEHVDYAVIPAYEPDERLVALSNALHDMACKLIVVDDGSSASCQTVWNALAEDTVVLHHSENRGKGAALKTAFRYLLDSGAPNGTVVTVDADGQHLPVDVRVVCDMAHLHPEAVVLGVRQFGPDTPARSQIGNRLTSALFRAASHQKLRDTQTGLRAFSIHMLPRLVDIAGERYEYEMNMLFACGRAHIPLVQTPVHTVYLDARNSTSHFCTVRDSVRIAKTFLKFLISSLTGFAADYLAFLILIHLTAALPYHVLISNVAARVLSAALNYQMNRMLVFEGRKKASETLLPYAALALGILVGNSILLMLFTNTLGIPAAAAKPLTEVLLFLISLSVQSLVIFRSKKGEGPHDKGKRKRRTLPLPVALMLDLCGAGLIVFTVYVVVYLMPVGTAPEPQALYTSGAAADSSGVWKERFADRFTDTVVTTEHSYTSSNLSINISEHSIGSGSTKAVYYLADVYMADLSCLQTYFAGGTYLSNQQELLTSMSRKLGAVLAINGDSYCFNHKNTNGMLIRNGMVYRTNQAISDIAVLYADGVFQTYPAAQFDAQQVIQDKTVQTWVFGPRLLDENGQIPSAYSTWDYIRKRHPRTAIGYFEPGHYCFLVADGRQKDYSNGMTLPELSQVFYDLGCKAAYNLDGGHTTGMVFQDTFVNHPYKADKKISDCIYICEPN